MRTFLINVSQKNISDAKQRDGANCMIAEAIRAKGASYVLVSAETIRFRIGNTKYLWPTPARAAVELKKFDEDKGRVKPFKFQLSANVGFISKVVHNPNKSQTAPRPRKKTKNKRIKRCKSRSNGLFVLKEAQ